MSKFVDLSDVKDQAKGAVDFWAGLIDASSNEGGVSQPTFRKDCAELIEADKLGALAKLLVANSSVLWKYSSGKEIESGYILLCSLMRDSSLDEQSSLAVDLANSLTRVEENKDATLQSRLLATVFNFFPSSKFGVLIAFVKHCILEKDDSVIEAQFQHISNWCQEWKLKGEEREELYATMTQLFQVCNHEKLAYESLLAAISWDSSAKNTAKSTQNLAAQCVAAALALPGLYELDVLLALPPVAALHSADAPGPALLTLLRTLVEGSVADFEALPPSTWTGPPALDRKDLLSKARLLALCAACDGHAELPYEEARSALGLSAKESASHLEGWIIRAMSEELLTGKLDQTRKVIRINSVVSRSFGPKQWDAVEHELKVWLAAVEKVQELVASGQQVTQIK